MTTTDYLQREIRRTELSVRRAERKPNTPPDELRGLHEKLVHLQEALEAVNEHWQRVHEQRGWPTGEPLTPEQLFDMEGKPVLLKYRWTEWCIVSGRGEYAVYGKTVRFTRKHGEVLWLSLTDYGKTWTAYAYPLAHIDKEKWDPCEECERRNCDNCRYTCLSVRSEPCNKCYNAKMWKPLRKYCPECGRPLTDEAWAELERRVFQ